MNGPPCGASDGALPYMKISLNAKPGSFYLFEMLKEKRGIHSHCRNDVTHLSKPLSSQEIRMRFACLFEGAAFSSLCPLCLLTVTPQLPPR